MSPKQSSVYDRNTFRHNSYLGSSSTLAQVLSHQAILQIAEASTLLEVVLWEEHIEQAQLFCLVLKILHDLWMCTEALFGRATDLLCVDWVGWDTFFIDELLDLWTVQSVCFEELQG